MSSPMIFGLEMEYPVLHLNGSKKVLEFGRLFRYLQSSAKEEFKLKIDPALSSFLPNGGKLYPDVGFAEWASPECASVYDITHFDLAGERLLAQLIPLAENRLKEYGADGRIVIYKYSTSPINDATVGSHENYLIPRKTQYFPDPDVFFLVIIRYLTPFLVARQLLCGAGKIDLNLLNKSDELPYQISQRSDQITNYTGLQTTSARPLINLRDEPLSDKNRFRRLHLIVGDANRSPWATFLKYGTTSLILRMITDNYLPPDIFLADPVEALQVISRDLTLNQTVLDSNNKKISALDILEIYLEHAKSYVAGNAANREDQDIVEKWEDVHNGLVQFRDQQNLNMIGRRLDWAVKLQFLDQYRSAENLTWRSMKLKEADLYYHAINSNGIQEKLVTPFEWPDYRDMTRFSDPMAPPTNTRAFLRGQAVKEGATEVSWNSWRYANGTMERIDDPATFMTDTASQYIPPDVILSALHENLQSPLFDVVQKSIQCLVGMKDFSAIPSLLKLTEHEDGRIRVAATQAIESLMEKRL